jgi:hypothetical protein
MKKLIALLAMVALVFSASAQFIQGPSRYPLFTNSAAILIPGNTTTNFPVTMCNRIPVGLNGVSLVFGCGATNATDTTNSVVLAELVDVDSKTGLTNVTDNQTYTLSVTHNGTTRSDYRTNLASTTANLGNAESLRIRSWQNTNANSVWLSNAWANVR